MLKLSFLKKVEPPKPEYAAIQTGARLDMLASDYALGKLTEQEYKDLCRTVNDGAMAEAEKRLKQLEEVTNEQDRNDRQPY